MQPVAVAMMTFTRYTKHREMIVRPRLQRSRSAEPIPSGVVWVSVYLCAMSSTRERRVLADAIIITQRSIILFVCSIDRRVFLVIDRIDAPARALLYKSHRAHTRQLRSHRARAQTRTCHRCRGRRRRRHRARVFPLRRLPLSPPPPPAARWCESKQPASSERASIRHSVCRAFRV